MKKISFLALIGLLSLQLVACGDSIENTQDNHNEPQEQNTNIGEATLDYNENINVDDNNETLDYEENITDEDIQESNIPEHVMTIFEQYGEILSSGNYNLERGEEILEDNDSTWYNFALIPVEPDDILSYPHVSFYRDGDYTEKSFSVDLIDENGYEYNSINKEIIYVTLMATNPDEDESILEDVYNNLINSYDGMSDSDVFELGNYKYYIEYTYFSGLGASISLNVVSIDEINISIDKEEYTEYEIDSFLAELNVGEKAIVKGEVAYISEDDYHYTLRVVNGNDKYYIFYDPSTFPKCFEEGCTYVFYGTIASSQDMESGCLRLDYFETE